MFPLTWSWKIISIHRDWIQIFRTSFCIREEKIGWMDVFFRSSPGPLADALSFSKWLFLQISPFNLCSKPLWCSKVKNIRLEVRSLNQTRINFWCERSCDKWNFCLSKLKKKAMARLKLNPTCLSFSNQQDWKDCFNAKRFSEQSQIGKCS